MGEEEKAGQCRIESGLSAFFFSSAMTIIFLTFFSALCIGDSLLDPDRRTFSFVKYSLGRRRCEPGGEEKLSQTESVVERRRCLIHFQLWRKISCCWKCSSCACSEKCPLPHRWHRDIAPLKVFHLNSRACWCCADTKKVNGAEGWKKDSKLYPNI